MSPFLFLPGVESSLEPAYSRMCKNVAAKNFSKVLCAPDTLRLKQEAVLLMSAQHLIFVFIWQEKIL